MLEIGMNGEEWLDSDAAPKGCAVTIGLPFVAGWWGQRERWEYEIYQWMIMARMDCGVPGVHPNHLPGLSFKVRRNKFESPFVFFLCVLATPLIGGTSQGK